MTHTLQYKTTDTPENMVTGPCLMMGAVIHVDVGCVIKIHDSLLTDNPVFVGVLDKAGAWQLMLPQPVYFSQGLTVQISAGTSYEITVLLA